MALDRGDVAALDLCLLRSTPSITASYCAVSVYPIIWHQRSGAQLDQYVLDRSTAVRLACSDAVNARVHRVRGASGRPRTAAVCKNYGVPPQSALLHRQALTLLQNRWSACLTRSSVLVLKLTFSPDPFPRNLPLSLSNGLISRFLSSTCTEASGVENIDQCGRLSQLRWLLGAF